MNIAEVAFYELYGERSEKELRLKYSGSFKSYNANVKYTAAWMEFKLSRQWKPISQEIQIGLIQSLLVKVFKSRDKKTINMDLYEHFIKGVGEYRPATKIDPILEQSFDRVNEKYFSNWMEKTNLIWGNLNFSKLGTFTYADNTITISKVLEDNQDLLDYVMYHEMLHKKHKYHTKGGRSHHHTPIFKKDEAKFDLENPEGQLTAYLRKKKWHAARETSEKSHEERKKRLWEWFFG